MFTTFSMFAVFWGIILCLPCPGWTQARNIHSENIQWDAEEKLSLIWTVHVKTNGKLSNTETAKNIAQDLNMTFIGKVRGFDNHFTLTHFVPTVVNHTIKSAHAYHDCSYTNLEKSLLKANVENQLTAHADILWFSHELILSRNKRWFQVNFNFMDFTDPYYRQQWHLTNTMEINMDINVTAVWKHNITGRGITVAIVDDGVEHTNPDLAGNYNSAGSWDLNDDDPDPMPEFSNPSNHHGTRCAGEISAIPNDVCGVGVAYGAKFSGMRLLDGPLTDSLEAQAFTEKIQINDIYSCSWGPDDDGRTVDGPHTLAAAAMKKGIDFGRHGYGSIYVVASGNGGHEGDNCNYDGYANSLYTVTIGAVDETGHMPYYAEECASMLAVTFSSASGGSNRDIVTTDWTSGAAADRTGCTLHHTGTSAAAPIAAGLVALMLEVQPCLTWRDVQYIIILTALRVDVDMAQWQKNAAGLWHSNKHGFGLMNAWRLTSAASIWDQVPWQTSFSFSQKDVYLPITKSTNNPLVVSYNVTQQDADGFDLYIVETVYVTLTLQHPHRGLLEMRLMSPHGTVSVIGASRRKDNSSAGFNGWTFSTVRCWGETPVGTWKLTITDLDDAQVYTQGRLVSWTLKIFGTPMTSEQFQARKRSVNEAIYSGTLNKNPRCPPPPVTASPDTSVSVKTLKIILMIGCFCFAFAIYETFEYILCYKEEKKEQSRTRKLIIRAHRLAQTHLYGDTHVETTETAGLLQNECSSIELQALINCDLAQYDLDLSTVRSNSAIEVFDSSHDGVSMETDNEEETSFNSNAHNS